MSMAMRVAVGACQLTIGNRLCADCCVVLSPDVRYWMETIRQHAGPTNVDKVLVGNKVDLPQPRVRVPRRRPRMLPLPAVRSMWRS